jgi:L-ascorbate metabolism protein UlaG (beta-lactamase superfamily)
MARTVSYTFKGKNKTIAFSYDKHHDLYEAVAEAEGIDLTAFLAMEQQVAMTSRKGAKAEKEYRKVEFTRFGFSKIQFVRDEEE